MTPSAHPIVFVCGLCLTGAASAQPPALAPGRGVLRSPPGNVADRFLGEVVAAGAPQEDAQDSGAGGALEKPPAEFTLDAAPGFQPFGASDQEWIGFGAGAGFGATEAGVYSNAYISYERFLAEGFEVVALAEGWGFDQDDGEDAIGAGFALDFRYHFVREEDYSLFASLGIGMVFTDENVPADGRDVNFTPRAGIGATLRLNQADTARLVVGLRWQHVSNARFDGGENNPGRDAAMLYAGVVFRF